MGVSFNKAEQHFAQAAAQLFTADPRVRSVGITRHGDAFGYRAVRNAAEILPFNASELALPTELNEVPVSFADAPGEIESLVKLPASGPGSPQAASVIPEVRRQRPLVCGLQIQNFDDDDRQGILAGGHIIIGTLGCFVRLANNEVALLSNNHVVAGENRGLRGSDRILQPGSGVFSSTDQIAALTDFKDILTSPAGASPMSGTVVWNEIDAGVAELTPGISWRQGYLSSRSTLVAPSGTATPRLGDQVFKVGRTTGLTFGEVVDVGVIVGPVGYDPGPCWFRRSITIEGLNGTQFSDRGDSGSAIVRTNGEVVALLYAGNGQQTYACQIDDVLSEFNCSLA